MRTNRGRSERVQLELAHSCGKQRQRLHRVQCYQSQAVLAQREPERQRVSHFSITRIQLQRVYRSDFVRNTRGTDRVLCATNLRRWPSRRCEHFSKPRLNRKNGSRGRDRYPQFTAHHRERDRRILSNRLHMRQRVTQIVVMHRDVLHTTPTFSIKPSSQEPNPVYSDLLRR